MKQTKLVVVVAISAALTALIVGVVSAAPARSNHASAPNTAMHSTISVTTDVTNTDDLTDTEGLTETDGLSGTHPMTQPVALAISIFFSGTYSDVIGLHDAGFGFGEIARAYFIAKLSLGGVTPQQLLDMAAGGMGWGEIMKQYAFKPGHGHNLGAIMSGHGGTTFNASASNGQGPSQKGPKDSKPNCPGNSCNAPGKNKGNH